MAIKWFDEATEMFTRRTARATSRRGFLGGLGTMLVGASAATLLPVFRSSAFAQGSSALVEEGDPNSCDYWRYCAIDGFLCGCCGGSVNSCPPGTVRSDITWIGTCRNPTDGKDYVRRVIEETRALTADQAPGSLLTCTVIGNVKTGKEEIELFKGLLEHNKPYVKAGALVAPQ